MRMQYTALQNQSIEVLETSRIGSLILFISYEIIGIFPLERKNVYNFHHLSLLSFQILLLLEI
jgi:hypothetical protein